MQYVGSVYFVALVIISFWEFASLAKLWTSALQGVYRAFTSKANLVNQQSVTHLNFMATCVIEIFGLSPEHAYRHAFAFIRNLAIELREAISEKKGESISKVSQKAAGFAQST